MEATATETKTLKQLSIEIARALGSEWSRSDVFDAEDSSGYDRNWRERLDGPGNTRLFLSNSWAKVKGMLYISGWAADFIERNQISVPVLPSINVNPLKKTAEQIANDIKRRLLPEYEIILADLHKKHVAHCEYKAAVKKTVQDVCIITGGYTREQAPNRINARGSSGGSDFEVTGPDQIRFAYSQDFTANQLRRLADALPEVVFGKRA